jgi:hypothetical protein
LAGWITGDQSSAKRDLPSNSTWSPDPVECVFEARPNGAVIRHHPSGSLVEFDKGGSDYYSGRRTIEDAQTINFRRSNFENVLEQIRFWAREVVEDAQIVDL